MSIDYHLVIFDWDWTLAKGENATEENPFRQRGEKYVWMQDETLHSNRKELLEWLHSDGVEIAVASNQGGIAFGLVDMEETKQAIYRLLKELDFPVPFLICPYHEKKPERYQGYAKWRKPEGEMLCVLRDLYPDVYYVETLVVGDREEDREAARRAGFQYRDAEEFFSGVQLDLEAFIRDEQNADEDFNHPPTGEVPDLETLALAAEDDDDGPPF